MPFLAKIQVQIIKTFNYLLLSVVVVVTELQQEDTVGGSYELLLS